MTDGVCLVCCIAAASVSHEDELNSFYSSLADNSKDATNAELEELLNQLKALKEKEEAIKLKKAAVVQSTAAAATAASASDMALSDRALQMERLRALQTELQQLDDEEMRDRKRAASYRYCCKKIN